MEEAIFNTEPQIQIDVQTVEHVKQRAAEAPRARFRLCLHRDHEDQIQEMLIALRRGTYVRPHRNRPPKTKSYWMVEGRLVVVLFDEAGRITGRVELAPLGTGKPFLFRFDATQWHTAVPRSEVAVYVESSPGPFRPGTDPELAPWSPAEGDADVAEYLAQLLEGPTTER